ncbi:phosphoethanolamine--lipid A transferase [Gammaproteobacteria bacterium LSUCC0112]|nr:phosphoethanolamine--lipid A transferase [Gammaproteobacteria bacterium LSUCC0112]
MSVLSIKSSGATILAAAFFFTMAYNVAFFRNVYATYPGIHNIPFLISLGILLVTAIALILGFIINKYTLKPVLIILFPLAATASYFMNSYNVIIDSAMLQNSVMTDSREVFDLLSPRMIAYLVLLGLLPAFVISRLKVDCQSPAREIAGRIKLIAVLCLIFFANLFLMADQYTSFFREHKDLRFYTNPLTLIYSSSRYISDFVKDAELGPRTPIGEDAVIARSDTTRKLIFLVVGEATRADHWAMNGYQRDTNALVRSHNVINLPNVSSCATSTAFSVPCMFSLYAFDDFSLRKARAQENVLDVLAKTGVNVLWRDNNSDSKGVADALAFEDFRSPETNAVCDLECRDIGMLGGLEDYINQHQEGDIVIVFHQMGNHGPAYYKRYPKEFEYYMPVCESNQLEQCTREEIVNAYDNALHYSDYFLANAITFLKPFQREFSTAMFYMADHGESLGELGLYLHGLPYAIAPDAQTQVASMMWLGDAFSDQQRAQVNLKAQETLSHDNFFHTLLGMLDVQTELYEPNLDILAEIDW